MNGRADCAISTAPRHKRSTEMVREAIAHIIQETRAHAEDLAKAADELSRLSLAESFKHTIAELRQAASENHDRANRLERCAKGEPEFQVRVQPWMAACFGDEVSNDPIERNQRFLEEALELIQACGATRSEAHQLVDYVFDRPVGELKQEIGGVMVTLAALCLAHNVSMHACGETELERIWTCVDKIRAKQAAKQRYMPTHEHHSQRS